jgi:hypothetical protein
MVPTLKIPKGALLDNGFYKWICGDASKDFQYENSVYS